MIAMNLPEVPAPGHIEDLIAAALPPHVLQAAMEANDSLREIGRLRPLTSIEDRADFEAELGRLATRNKQLAAHHPRFVVSPWGRAV